MKDLLLQKGAVELSQAKGVIGFRGLIRKEAVPSPVQETVFDFMVSPEEGAIQEEIPASLSRSSSLLSVTPIDLSITPIDLSEGRVASQIEQGSYLCIASDAMQEEMRALLLGQGAIVISREEIETVLLHREASRVSALRHTLSRGADLQEGASKGCCTLS